MKTENLRRGQREALDIIIARLKAGEPYTTIVQPTRYGKSDLMRLVALFGEKEGCLGWSTLFSPLVFLRDQLIADVKLRDFVRRYDIPTSFARRCFAWSSSAEQLFQDRRRLIVSTTMQMATQNVRLCAELAEEVKHRTGLPLVVQIDECHEVSDQKKRGELVHAMVDAGALAVLYTATPVREDGELIPGFETIELSSRERHRYELTGELDADSGREIVRVWHQAQNLVQLKAHHTTTYRQAWDEQPSPLCRLSRDVIDVELTKITGDKADQRKLSECDLTTARNVISRVGRDPGVITRGADMLVQELIKRRRAWPQSAAIVFTGNDQKDDAADNRHAKEVAESIRQAAKRHDIRLVVRIITMKSEEGVGCAEALRDFVDGDGDVLIVKQIGGVGLDCERIKVVLDLSSVRTVASVMQRVMRCATPWNGCKVGTVITLADPMMTTIWDQFIVAEGGDAGSWHTEQETFVRDQLKDPSTGNDPSYVVNGAGLSRFDDSDGGNGPLESWSKVEALFDTFPELTGLVTKPEAAERLPRLESGGAAAGCAESLADFESASQQCERLRAALKRTAKELASKRGIRHWPDRDDGVYGDFMRETYNQVKRSCGVPLSMHVDEVTDPDVMARMVSAAQTMVAAE